MVHVRPYTLADFDSLLALQRAAFPPPFPEELLWSREQIAAHTEVFPRGALAAIVDGQIAGSGTALLITYTGEPHTWEEVSADGFILGSHEPDGDSLYGIDLCVHPAFRGRGIAGAIYEARKELVRKLRLKRFIAGCRIPGYHLHAKQLTAEQYVAKVAAGDLKDQVLSFMLKQGLRPLQVLSHYLEDDESLDHAVLVEWPNDRLR